MSLLYRMGTGNGGSDIKPYTVNFECANGYIGQTLTMTYQGTPHAGEVVDNVSGTVGSDGTLTLYPMHSGIWECSCYSSVTGETMTKTIDLSYWGVQPTVTFEDIPNGATVTPTDDVQTWLHCADVWNKSYTTISEVVADTTTLNTLIANENANDYLVRSTTFATDLCSNESAMTYIGLNDYCANKLLADSTWLEAICNSAYFEKVLNVKVPTMKSNTTRADGVTPSGVCKDNESSSRAYIAFDGNDTTELDLSNQVGSYFQYMFPKPVRVNKVRIYNMGSEEYCVRASKDGSNSSWVNLYDGITRVDMEQKLNIPNNEYYKYYRLYQTKKLSGNTYNWIMTLQFYGREEA